MKINHTIGGIWLIILLAISGVSFGTQNKLTNSPDGSIRFESTTVNFGEIKRGEKKTASFPYRNGGKGVLVIQGVQTPCDCTVVTSAKGQSTAPGESGVIEIIFDSTDYSGQVAKAVTVITNERAMPDRTLTLTALVNSEVIVDPPLADFGEVFVGDTPEKSLRLKGNFSRPLVIEKVRANEDFFAVTTEKSGTDWIVRIALKSKIPIGFLKDTIYIKNNSSALPEIPIPVRSTVKGPIDVSQNYVEFGSIGRQEKSDRELTLTSKENFEIDGTKVEVLVNGSKITTQKSPLVIRHDGKSSLSKRLTMSLQNDGTNSGSVHGKVNLETNSEKQPSIVIDFYAFFK